MTRDEIRLIVFILCAIALGSVVKWWRERDPRPPAVVNLEKKSGWADPPYVFKSKAAMEKVGADVERAGSAAQSETPAVPAQSR
jgi:hypothetical protein